MKKFGEIVVEAGLITPEQFKRVLAEKKKSKKRLGELIVAMDIASEAEIAQALSSQLGYPFVELTKEKVSPEAVAVIDEAMARQDLAFPYAIDDDSVFLAMADPLSFSTIDDIRFRTGLKVNPVIATTSDILKAIENHHHIVGTLDDLVLELGKPVRFQIMTTAEPTRDVTELKKKSEAPPIVRTVNAIISNAINNRASDIHIEPQKNLLIVRDRVDGMLRKVLELPKWVHQSVVSRVKIMSSLDISDKRRPQDGRFRVQSVNAEIDLRVSTLPTRFGEKVEIRLLNSKEGLKTIDNIGLNKKNLEKVKQIIESPQGVILLTGPTGSGKSSSLYAFLRHISKESVNIVTLEDPIEYEMPGISQVQVNEKAGLTFATGLRSILRQDPDVIMVGEMRDQETAEIAMKASLTGHLVLSTLHTNDVVSTITRLVDIGIPHYLIASSLMAVMSQRLVRVICLECKEPYTPSETECEQMQIPRKKIEKTVFYKGKGCDTCNKTGYFGRMSIFEILIMDKTLRRLVAEGETEAVIEDAAHRLGMVPLWDDAREKVLAGITTVEEIVRVAKRKEGHCVICSSCGEEVRMEYHICPYCGHKRDDLCPSCEEPVEEDWTYCPNCTKSLKKDDWSSALKPSP
ncbi:MAG: Flp pilus assembly complex ATPase component TadA [Proteobacteria bacterium]|nr:Flp pilus assembly complex ATPase component TadA [Pseudomonadota bacterium]